ncbi:MAG: thioesterase family protein [Spirochaetales bacterium]|uniref:Thioesterase family protein n=1 Tax=Candidatus Thalassospirochaeta sargassi TaxID=3119039 RepID=A0AAJ1IIH2_9SPIO|nr:thioesterase family protein [Spirochaetales bacterium]
MNEKSIPSINDFPLKTTEKIRYRDTDRQGHVNNAVFSTFLEAGRVELLYNSGEHLTSPGSSFVIASLKLDFLNEINWPGEIEIGTVVKKIGRSSITLEQGLFQHAKYIAQAETVIVQMNNKTRKSKPLNDFAIEKLNCFINK